MVGSKLPYFIFWRKMITQRAIITEVCKELGYARGAITKVFKAIEHTACEELYFNNRFMWYGVFNISRRGDGYVALVNNSIETMWANSGNLSISFKKSGIKRICRYSQLSEMDVSLITSCIQRKLIASIKQGGTVLILDGVVITYAIDKVAKVKHMSLVASHSVSQYKIGKGTILVGLYTPYSTHGEVCRYRKTFAHKANKSQKL